MRFSPTLLLALVAVSASLGAQAGTPVTLQTRLPLQPTRTIAFETTEGSMMDADVSPDGRMVVFSLLGNLYKVPIAGGEAVQLTRGMAWSFRPAWSPDGKSIAYLSDGDGSNNLWITDSDSTHAYRLSAERNGRSAFFWTWPRWTPDGSGILARDVQGRGYVYALAGGKLALSDTLQGILQFSPDGRYAYINRRDSVRRYDRRTGNLDTLASLPVGYGTPVVSPDGRWLAYVTGPSYGRGPQNDARNGLRIRNLETGADRWLAHPIGRGRSMGSSGDMGWDAYAFTPDSRAIVIGFEGKLHRIDVLTGQDAVIPFTAQVKRDVGPFLYNTYRVTNDSLTVRNTRSANVSPDGTRLVFTALGALYTMVLPGGMPRPLVSQQRDPQAQPIYSPDGRWLAYVTWNDTAGGHVWRVPAAGGAPQRLTQVAALYKNPTWSPDGKTIAVVKESATMLGSIGFSYPYQSGTLQLISVNGGMARTLMEQVPLGNRLTFTPDGQRLTYLGGTQGAAGQEEEERSPLYSVRLDGTDRRVIATIAGTFTRQAVPSPDGRYVAFVTREDLYVAALPFTGQAVTINDSTSSVPVVRITNTGGIDPQWENGGKALSWSFANTFFRIDPDRAIAEVIRRRAEGHRQDEFVPAPDRTVPISLRVPRHAPRGMLVLRGARVISMKGQEVLEDGTVIVVNDRIAAVGPSGSVRIPAGARVIDVRGKTIMPGLADLHAHLWPPYDVPFQNWWKFLASLAYGCTLTRDPQAGNDAFAHYELIESGRMMGPRFFSTGRGFYRNTARLGSLEDTRAFLQHYKAQGASSLKMYDTYMSRQQRQWVVMAAREAGINVTSHPGPGWNNYLDLTPMVDGYSGWEHGLPVIGNDSTYGDVARFVAASKTWYTPTLIAGGASSENGAYFLRHHDMYGDPKVRRFFPDDHFSYWDYGLSLADDPTFRIKSAGAAAILRSGGHVGMGSHGDDPGIACHWEMWALQSGGLSNHEALRVATLSGAEGLGMQQDLGSIEVGKLADLLILDRNPLEDIRNSLSIRYVMKNGELYDGNTLETLWPHRKPAPVWRYRHGDVRYRRGDGPDMVEPSLPVSLDTPAVPPARRVAFETKQGTAMNVDVSPDGRTIVFDLLGDIYTVPIAGGAARRLTSGPAFDGSPVFSPDGASIAFVSDRSGTNNLWVMQADGAAVRPLTRDTTGDIASPEWVPGRPGQLIARKADGYWRYDSAGVGTKLPYPIPTSAVWSRDGKYVYYPRAASNWRDAGGIARVVTATGAAWTISRGQLPTLRAAVSPDGKWVVFGTRRENRMGLRLLNVETEEERWLLAPLTSQREYTLSRDPDAGMPRFTFTPDGRALILASGGTFQRVDMRTGAMRPIGFRAQVEQWLAPLPVVTAKPPSALATGQPAVTGTVALQGATVITMREQQVIPDATVVVTGNRIVAVGPRATVPVPVDAVRIDMTGKTIIPGLIDVRGAIAATHGPAAPYNLALLANLAFGVTTVRDLESTEGAMAYAARATADRSLAPRIFAGQAVNIVTDKITSSDSAVAVVRRYKTGGAQAIKVTGPSRRQQRQWLAAAAWDNGVALVGDAGDDLRRTLTMIVDGYQAIEGPLPNTPLYDDVLQLVAASHVIYTPTLLTVGGNVTGEAYFREPNAFRDDPRLSRFGIDEPGEHRWTRRESYRFIPVSEQAARLRALGTPVAVGTQGKVPGIGVHWEMWSLQLGGFSPYEALRAATATAADALGLGDVLGTIAPGKLADLVILDANPLVDLQNSRTVRFVMRDGALFDAFTLATRWPRMAPAPVVRDTTYDPPSPVRAPMTRHP